MYKTDKELRALPIISGGDEPPKDPPADDDPAAAALAAKDEEIAILKTKSSEYEKMVLSDDYLTFLASQRQPPPPPPDESQDVTEEELESMSKKELVNLILTNVGQMVQETLKKEVAPLRHEVAQDKFQEQVQKTADKYEDFWTFKNEMIQIAQAHPTLHAEQVYKLAGGTGKLKTAAPPAPSGGPTPPKKPPVRSSLPVASGPVSKKFVPTKTIEAASKVYDDIFGKEE